MYAFKRVLLLLALVAGYTATAQRSYKPHSVLAAGTWVKLAVAQTGVYRLDMGFLKTAGFPATIPANQLRVFGRRQALLPESNAAPRADDLEELAIQVFDGGDGTLDGADFGLFYAEGPHTWIFDSAQNRYTHQQNIYSELRYYFVTVGGDGKRLAAAPPLPAPVAPQTYFEEHYFHELDSVNFLSSGKGWYGEAFSGAPGRTLNHTFLLPGAALAGTPVTLVTAVAARALGSPSRFEVRVNSQAAASLTLPAVFSSVYSAFAQEATASATLTAASPALEVGFTFFSSGFNAQGWLNWFEIFYQRPLALPADGQLLFRDAAGTAAGFALGGADARTQVWDVSDALNPVVLSGTLANTTYLVPVAAPTRRECMGFLKTLTPQLVGAVAPQDLHQTSEADLLIITYPLFAAQAQRVAQFHQIHDGLRTTVVTTEQVYNEFSAGLPDVTALRDFVKMYYDRYRATWLQSPKYLLLFGAGSFDYKARLQNNTSFVPAYESAVSLDPLNTYTSDDFFGLLDDAEDVAATTSGSNLDIGIGRIPAATPADAKAFADKLEAYAAPPAFGPWRTQLTFVADDEDGNLHLQDAESLTAVAGGLAPVFNLQKIYLDAFRQEGGAAGGRYPQAAQSSNNALYNGTLIWNYSGHGGPTRLAEEVVLDAQAVNNLENPYKLPLFITATCDFAPYDNPLIQSLGSNLLLRPRTGAIGLTTTTRLVFAFSNRVLNSNYLQMALQRAADSTYRSLGEALRVAKNITYQTGADVVNNRKFTLLGDPALTLAFPKVSVNASRINGMDISKSLDTLHATDAVVLDGEVHNGQGALLPAFNGTVYLSLFDKPQTTTTLGNDAGSAPVSFQMQTSLLFKGKASVAGGRFQFRFRLPKDLNYAYGRGKISLYAEDGSTDGAGVSDSVVIGGIGNSGAADVDGPGIKAYLNDEQFVPGGVADAAPILLVKLADSSGINTGSASVDHDIVATLDGDNRQYYVLNNFYETELDNAHRGSVRFQLPELAPGPHSLTIKAWDVLNNSSEYNLPFVIVPAADLTISHVLNYPNPFTTSTAFWFEHNQPGIDLSVRIDIFTITGRRVKTIAQTINSAGNRSSDLEWNGRDEVGDRLARGVYLYRLTVRTPGGQSRTKLERLVLLN